MSTPSLFVTGTISTIALGFVGLDLLIAQTFSIDTATGALILAIIAALGGLWMSNANLKSANKARELEAAARTDERRLEAEERKAIRDQLHNVTGQNTEIAAKVDGTASRAVEEIKGLRDTVLRLETTIAKDEKRAELLAQAQATRPVGPIAAVVNGTAASAESDAHVSAAATQAKAAAVQVEAAEAQLDAAKGRQP